MRRVQKLAFLGASALTGPICVGLYLVFFRSIRYPFGADSASYIEAARNLKAGIGLYTTQFDIDLPDQDLVRLTEWPPGFSLLLAGASSLGLDPRVIAPWFGHVPALVVPVLMMALFRQTITAPLLLFVGILVATSPGFLFFQFLALTDLMFLALAIMSIGLLLGNTRASLHQVVLSGMFAGLAYAVRNVGVALLAALPLSQLLAYLLKIRGWSRVRRDMVIWVCGAAIFVAPLLAFNLAASGVLQPYKMAPSTLGLMTNLRAFLAAALGDLFGAHIVGTLAWMWQGLLCITAANIAIAAATMLAWRTMSNDEKYALIVLIAYFAIGSSVVVYARTKYQWGEQISERFAFQYSWAILISMMIIGSKYAERPRSRTMTALLLLVIGSGLMGLRIYDVTVFYQRIAGTEKQLRWQQNRELITAMEALPPNAFVVSDMGWLFRIETSRRVRTWPPLPDDPKALSAALSTLRGGVPKERPIYVLVSSDAAGTARPPSPDNLQSQLNESGFHIEQTFEIGATLITDAP